MGESSGNASCSSRWPLLYASSFFSNSSGVYCGSLSVLVRLVSTDVLVMWAVIVESEFPRVVDRGVDCGLDCKLDPRLD